MVLYNILPLENNNDELLGFVSKVVSFKHLDLSKTNKILSFTLPTEIIQTAF